jgi:phosphate transport system substrate-binding protein
MKKTVLSMMLFCQLVYGYAQASNWAWGDVLAGSDFSEVTASSALSDSQGWYPAQNLIDTTYRTWAEGAQGNGAGESFTLAIRSGPEQIAGFALKNGYGDLNFFQMNNRVKSFKIYIDGGYIETTTVKDSIHFEQYAFETPAAGEKIQFVIDSVYPGTAYDDTCVAEIALLKTIVTDEVFHDNILRMVSPRYTEGPSQYINHKDGMEIISDPDKIILSSYMPFDYRDYYKTKAAVLDNPSSLKLSVDLPRLDGATALYPLYSAFVHAVYPEVDSAGNNGLDWPYFPNFEWFNGWIGRDEFFSLVQCNKTPQAYERLINGEADLIFCYEPSAAEIEAAAEKGVVFNLTPIAKDAFIFIVNANNIAANITQGQIRDIYSGRVTNWKGISGNDDVIIPYQREENSGSQTVFQTIMGGENAVRPIIDGRYIPRGMFGMLEMVASNYYNYNSAVGYTFLFYLNQMAGKQNVKALSIDGIPPTRETIRSGVYPFTQTVYAVSAGSESGNTKRFIEWIISPQGQELVEKTGYTPLHR